MTRTEASELTSSLYDTWGPTLWRGAFRATHSAETADDLVQEAFMAFYRALRDGLTVKSPRAWLLAVLRNQISKLERAHRRHGEQLEPHDVMDSFPSEPLGLPEYTADEIQLGDYVAALSKREEEVLMLRLSSLKYREIGEELGITTRAVSTLLARALAKLQTAVKRKQVGLPIPTRTSRDIPKTLH